jgi:putative FmdB family regulatory protein
VRENPDRQVESPGAKEDPMPVYEYTCKNCGKRFEITAHWDERDEKAVCPKCKSKDVEQRFSSFACEPPKRW